MEKSTCEGFASRAGKGKGNGGGGGGGYTIFIHLPTLSTNATSLALVIVDNSSNTISLFPEENITKYI